jgi:hypothetical protein
MNSDFGSSFRRRNPLDNSREPRMGRLALVPLAAAALFTAAAWIGHKQVEQSRMRAVAAAVVADGHAGPVHVEPLRGAECWRAREGFAWTSATASGWACAGPGGEVRLQERTR